MNAEIAREMWGQYKETYLPMEKQFATEAFNTDTEAKRVEQAGLANADVASAFGNQREQRTRQMASMGLDPSSGAWADQDSKMRLSEAAASAGAKNAARRNVENMGYARKQDAISIGKGMPGTAAASMAQSGNQYGQIANANIQQEQNESAGLGNAIGGAAAAYGMTKYKDGGMVEQRLAGGGMAGNPRMQQVMVSPNVMPVARGGLSSEARAGLEGVKTYRNVNKAYEIGQKMMAQTADPLATPPPGTEVFPSTAPAVAPEGVPIAAESAPAATAATDAAATTAAETAAAEAGTAEAGTAAAGTAAAAEATTATAVAAAPEAAAGLAAIGPVGWAIGAGLLASQLLKADGGEVEVPGDKANDKETPADERREKRIDLNKGGKIKGAGTETSDSIPAKTRGGSYILNAETVKILGKGLTKSKVPLRVSKNEIAVPPELVQLIGKDKLDKINRDGLQARYGLSYARRGA
ncbi:hypothetical protein GW813_07515 [bacterium]|nr:hypothetical protein [bacterium]